MRTQDTDPPTVVIFRVWRGKAGGGDVIALFPEVPADYAGRLCSSFEHIGQHGAADYAGVLRRTRPATAAEADATRRELEGAPYGYRLQVRQRWTRGRGQR